MTDLFDITHGAGGIWDYHQWNGDIILNQVAGTDPRYFVENIDGLHSLPERNRQNTPRTGRLGENRRPTNALGKTVVYSGEIIASTVPKLRLARTQLVAAFADTVNQGYMDIIPQTDDTSPTSRFYADPLQLDISDKVTDDDRGNLHRPFILGLRLSDPRFYFPSLAVDETDSSLVTVTNPGSAPADPIITITGTSSDVVISDGTRTLTFADVPSGTLVVDFGDPRSAKVGSSNVKVVVASSDWWDGFVDGIATGSTVSISQTGGTSINVQFTPSDWS